MDMSKLLTKQHLWHLLRYCHLSRQHGVVAAKDLDLQQGQPKSVKREILVPMYAFVLDSYVYS
jgi:hypothetical protein